MMMPGNERRSAQEIIARYREQQLPIRQRLLEFSNVPPSEYFYELLYCLLTPQSSAVNAASAIRALRECDFLNREIDPEPYLRTKAAYIRFHKTKANNCRAAKLQFGEISDMLMSGGTGSELREWLVGHVRGFGWKESSHFLRNIGYRDLAILDRHILRNLLRLGVIRRMPKTLTPRRYKLLEKKFHTFALQVGITLDELDLLFWSMETGEILK
jgi:N-glycosylase/DNA lyase